MTSPIPRVLEEASTNVNMVSSLKLWREFRGSQIDRHYIPYTLNAFIYTVIGVYNIDKYIQNNR